MRQEASKTNHGSQGKVAEDAPLTMLSSTKGLLISIPLTQADLDSMLSSVAPKIEESAVLQACGRFVEAAEKPLAT